MTPPSTSPPEGRYTVARIVLSRYRHPFGWRGDSLSATAEHDPISATAMTARSIVYDQTAQRLIANGVRKLAQTVSITLGPRGRNVVSSHA